MQHSLWNVPFRRNPFFTGREEILTRLHNELQNTRTAALSQPIAMSGLGGIGKTQTAVEYAYRYQDHYQAVLWVKSNTPEELAEDFATLAKVLQLAEHEQQAQEQSRVIAAVKRWLETYTQWLLIFDNADDLPIVRDYIPVKSRGHILLTTRAHATSGIATKIEIPIMDDTEGTHLLLERAGIINHDTSIEQVAKNDIQLARQIVQELGGLPLALDQAGAYIEETGESLSNYLLLYQDQREELLQWKGSVSDHAPVATTWTMAFQNIEQNNPAAIELIRFCAFLAPDMIPEELLTKTTAQRDIALRPSMSKQTILNKDPLANMPSLDITLQPSMSKQIIPNKEIAALLKYSLVQRDHKTKTISIHRLVQTVIRDSMSKAQQKKWIQQVVQTLGTTFPFDEVAPWIKSQRYLTHALQAATYIHQWSLTFIQARNLLNNLGSYFFARGQYQEAESFSKDHLIISEKIIGPAHPDTAGSLNNLANLYKSQGRYTEAEPLLQRALTIYEKHLGPDHLDTAISLNNLGILYKSQGRYTEAEPLLQRALTIYEKHLGLDHPDTANCLNNLANLYRSQGRYTEAEPLLQRALTIHEKRLGPDHPDTAGSFNNLGYLYNDQDRYTEAEPLLQRALTIHEKRLGPDHPDTAISLNNLGYLYKSQGRYTEAEPLLQRALTIHEKHLGPDHPDTATSLNNLGILYKSQGRYTEAEPLLQRALTIREKHLEPDHPDTAISLNNLGDLYNDQGRYTEAEPLLQRALTIREKRLGPDHPKTIRVREQHTQLEQRKKAKQSQEAEQ